MPAVTVSIINLKGRVGKSTLPMLLSEFLAFRYGKNVLLIDMDAQANLSYCMVPEYQIEAQNREGRTAYHLLQAGFRSCRLDIGDYISLQPPLVVSNVSRSGTYGTDIHMVVSTPSVAQLDEDLLELWSAGQSMPQQLMQRNEARAEFRGVILNVVKHYRNTHSRVSEEIYSRDRRRYEPFDYWLPDNERLRTIGEYDPDVRGKWAGGSEHKFSDVHHK